MSKLNILVVPSDKYGVGKYRSISQHVRLQELYPDDYSITISHNFNFDNSAELSKYDLIHIHKVPYNDFDTCDDRFLTIKGLGIPYIVDIDDHWKMPVYHPHYKSFADGKRTASILNGIRSANYVTTTTPIMAKEISKINKNVLVLPNAINPNDKQCQINPKKNNFDFRLGWLGGSSHINDIELMSGLFGRIHELDNTQMVLCGFDLRGFKYIMNASGKPEMVPMDPADTDWYKYEQIVTNKFQWLNDDPTYVDQLKMYKQLQLDDTNKKYRRIWTKNIEEFLTGYNEFDVALAPLYTNDYNRLKSQLKVIEAGFFKKAVIAQNFGPYQIDIIDGKNGLLVDPSKNHKDWFKKAKLLHDNPEMVKDLGEALYETVIDKYHLDVVTKQRHEFYQSLKL